MFDQTGKERYKRQLQNPKWQQKRLKIFERDKFECQHCHDDESELHVHHKYYKPNLEAWEYPDDCYITLCYVCHEREPIIWKNQLRAIEQYMQYNGFDSFDQLHLLTYIMDKTPKQFQNDLWVLMGIDTLKSLNFDFNKWLCDTIESTPVPEDDKSELNGK